MLLAAPAAAGADCVWSATAVEVSVEGCVPIADFARARTAGQFRWVRDHVDASLRDFPRVVLSGRVLRERRIEPVAVGEPEPPTNEASSRQGSWILAQTTTCEGVRAGASAYFRESSGCCDLFPPQDVPCLLEIGVLEPRTPDQLGWLPAPEPSGGDR